MQLYTIIGSNYESKPCPRIKTITGHSKDSSVTKTRVHEWVAFHVVLIKSADPGKLLIIRRDKGADHRYLLELGISRRRLITKLRSRASWPGLCRALAAIRVRNYAMGSFGSVKNQLHEVQVSSSSAPKMNSCGNRSRSWTGCIFTSSIKSFKCDK